MAGEKRPPFIDTPPNGASAAWTEGAGGHDAPEASTDARRVGEHATRRVVAVDLVVKPLNTEIFATHGATGPWNRPVRAPVASNRTRRRRTIAVVVAVLVVAIAGVALWSFSPLTDADSVPARERSIGRVSSPLALTSVLPWTTLDNVAAHMARAPLRTWPARR